MNYANGDREDCLYDLPSGRYNVPMPKTDEEKKRGLDAIAEAEANLAIEGIYLTDAEKALFLKMEEEDLTSDERIARLKAYMLKRPV